MICSYCKTSNEDTNEFCSQCGCKLNDKHYFRSDKLSAIVPVPDERTIGAVEEQANGASAPANNNGWNDSTATAAPKKDGPIADESGFIDPFWDLK